MEVKRNELCAVMIELPFGVGFHLELAFLKAPL